MTVENNLRSLIPEINIILSRVVSSLANSEDISGPALATVRDDLQQAQIYLLQCLPALQQTGIEPVNEQLQMELEDLRQQKRSLLSDIQQLQQQRQQMLSEFVNLLSTRLNEVLSQQLGALSVSQVDSTFRAVFDSLEQDLQSYYESLSQGLERMHRLGQQGETKLLAYVNQLSQYLESQEKVKIIWYLGMEINPDGLLMVFSKQTGDNLELYPLSWTLEGGDELRMPLSLIPGSFSDWLGSFKLTATSWLKESLLATETVFISGEGADLSPMETGLLDAGIVSAPQQILSIEPGVATLVSYLPVETIAPPLTTLVVYGGRETIELILVDIPPYPLSLPRESISLSRLAYGDTFYEQDILRHLIYPAWQSFLTSSLPPLTTSRPGIPDKFAREKIKDELLNHALGESLLEAAQLAKLILACESQFTCQLMNHDWTIDREDLNTRILEPLSNKLQEEIQGLLEKRGQNFKDIQQVLSYGKLLPFVYPYFTGKLGRILAPDAIVHPLDETDGRIGMGLARLPLFTHLYRNNKNVMETTTL
ncbi:MAG: hypothetical protein N5P05_000998 [Chroococcopsis gigantea SAG 12.99]|jgi:FtsZ-binding cell division protein ZapB|nr:hypothetical protein [Chlorogloea purpurea SAG 13.99]MDV2999392.1 hypothetical protein [Chroococcopsis gigantea SAG 12.99]